MVGADHLYFKCYEFSHSARFERFSTRIKQTARGDLRPIKNLHMMDTTKRSQNVACSPSCAVITDERRNARRERLSDFKGTVNAKNHLWFSRAQKTKIFLFRKFCRFVSFCKFSATNQNARYTKFSADINSKKL